MTLYEVLHWLTSEVEKLAGKATAAEVHAAISALERGGKPHAVSPPEQAPEQAPAVEQGTAEPSTAEVLAEVLAAIRGMGAGDTAAAPEPPAETTAPPAPPEPTAPAVDPGQAPEG